MSVDKQTSYKIIEAVPGERVHRVVRKVLKQRSETDNDILLRIQVLGEKKEILITRASTKQSIFQALNN